MMTGDLAGYVRMAQQIEEEEKVLCTTLHHVTTHQSSTYSATDSFLELSTSQSREISTPNHSSLHHMGGKWSIRNRPRTSAPLGDTCVDLYMTYRPISHVTQSAEAASLVEQLQLMPSYAVAEAPAALGCW
jgi:methylaspartate ammonia-lyase